MVALGGSYDAIVFFYQHTLRYIGLCFAPIYLVNADTAIGAQPQHHAFGVALFFAQHFLFWLQLMCHGLGDIGVQIADIPLPHLAVIAVCTRSEADIWRVVPIAGIMSRLTVL